MGVNQRETISWKFYRNGLKCRNKYMKDRKSYDSLNEFSFSVQVQTPMVFSRTSRRMLYHFFKIKVKVIKQFTYVVCDMNSSYRNLCRLDSRHITMCSNFFGICFSTSCFNLLRRNGRST